ncbi:hypothetical protein DLAC_05542 [Tieghemostelium lacteum]|uniref:FNIP repeat-containing protein n=1 Tax=Tieghemostelium lacteum TaxID=361077 RepID=A0A151ZG49_TIELA|nr:hypothetical protein DLAC_05542 [Tieghemostelium lacteum]|eukprot:KYQ92943.1 hypothetical protein DLAC_05542 [Tieghemostelium lacteum]
MSYNNYLVIQKIVKLLHSDKDKIRLIRTCKFFYSAKNQIRFNKFPLFYYCSHVAKRNNRENSTDAILDYIHKNKDFVANGLPNKVKVVEINNKLECEVFNQVFLSSVNVQEICYHWTPFKVQSIFTPYQNRNLTESQFPLTILSIKILDKDFSRDITDDCFPKSLQSLYIETNCVIRIVSVPQNLEELTIAAQEIKNLSKDRKKTEFRGFNHQISDGLLPKGLVKLELGYSFNTLLTPGCLPSSLQYLAMYGYNHEFQLGTLPNQLKTLILGLYDREIVHLPPNLEILDFQDKWMSPTGFNKPLVRESFPVSLKTLKLGHNFDQLLNNGLPVTLTSLSLRYYYRELSVGCFPMNLYHLELNCNSISMDKLNEVLPIGCRSLTFGYPFDKSLENIPNYIEYLELNGYPHQITKLPDQLKSLKVNGYPHSFSLQILPQSLEVLVLNYTFQYSIVGSKFPSSLKSLTLGAKFYIGGFQLDMLPPNLIHLQLAASDRLYMSKFAPTLQDNLFLDIVYV